MQFNHKTDDEIARELMQAVRAERSRSVEAVLYFCEVVKRNLHLKGKRSSLFSYILDLGYSRDQALVRKDVGAK